MDIVFHGPRLILAEFTLAILLCGAFGLVSLSSYLRSLDHPLFTVLFGVAMVFIAFNYVPLLLYAVSIVRHSSAHQAVAFELEHKDVYARRHALLSLFLMIPLAIPFLALSQEIQKRSRIDQL